MTFNDEVWVAPNEWGLQIWRDHWKACNLPAEYLRLKVRGGWVRCQLWEVMMIWGEYLYNGCQSPFRTLEIRLTEPVNPWDMVRP